MVTKHDRKIEQCKQGNAQALEWLYKTYAPVLMGVCIRYVKSKMQAEDIVHESFITIFEKIGDLKNNSALEGWMKRIVVNNALQFLKKYEFQPNIDEICESNIATNNPANTDEIRSHLMKQHVSQTDMLQIINELPVGYRSVFNMFVFEQMSHYEIAKELNISASTSRSQLQRARKMVQTQLIELEKGQNKDNKKFVALLLIMSEDLEYIDEICTKSMMDFKHPISTKANFGKQFPNYSSSISRIINNLFTIKTGLIAIGGAGIISLLVIFGHKSNNNTKKQFPVVTCDSLKIAAPSSLLDTISIVNDSCKNQADTVLAKKTVIKKDVIHKKVMVKKVVKVKKHVTITDTIRINDTLRSQ